jgi:hypothetical protein
MLERGFQWLENSVHAWAGRTKVERYKLFRRGMRPNCGHMRGFILVQTMRHIEREVEMLPQPVGLEKKIEKKVTKRDLRT